MPLSEAPTPPVSTHVQGDQPQTQPIPIVRRELTPPATDHIGLVQAIKPSSLPSSSTSKILISSKPLFETGSLNGIVINLTGLSNQVVQDFTDVFINQIDETGQVFKDPAFKGSRKGGLNK